MVDGFYGKHHLHGSLGLHLIAIHKRSNCNLEAGDRL